MVAGWLFVVAACSASTAPDPTLSPETTAPATTTTVAIPTTTATTAAPTTTTTQSPNERLAEIEALAKDAIMGRLQAIHDEDFDALLFWAGSQKSYDDSTHAPTTTMAATTTIVGHQPVSMSSAMERNSELPTEAFVGQLQLSSRRTFPRQSRLCRDSRHAHRRRGRDCGRSGRNLLHHHRHLVARRRRTLPTRRHLARRHPTGAMDRRVRPGTTRDHPMASGVDHGEISA